MNDRPIFMLTHGRTGSTWVQRILNLHPHITMWGEHYGFLDGVAKGYFRFIDNYARDGMANCDKQVISRLVGPVTDEAIQPEWYNPFTQEELTALMRRLIEDLFARPTGGGAIRWGFKEIRYEDKMVPRFLDALFPESQALILRRELLDMLRSQVLAWSREVKGRDIDSEEGDDYIRHRIQVVRRQEGIFQWAKDQIPGRVMELRYEDLVSNFEDEVQRLFAFLGEDIRLIETKHLKTVRRTKQATTRRDDALIDRIRAIVADEDARAEAEADA
ncbi:MAG: sulfotransferase [Planctomycetes bacterium]|nr:sulfotransferase [Planctomycetota bacterium]